MPEPAVRNQQTATVNTGGRAGYQTPTTRVRDESRRNIDAGLSKAQKEALSREESRIRQLDHEEAVVVDANGVVNPLGSPSVAAGRTNRRGVTQAYTSIMTSRVPRNSILTHNHPNFVNDTTSLAARIGDPFSAQDVLAAATLDVKEIRAVGKGYTYALKRPAGGWPWGFVREYQGRVRNTVMGNLMAQRGMYEDRSQAYNGAVTRANVAGKDTLLRELARKYGVSYTRRRTN